MKRWYLSLPKYSKNHRPGEEQFKYRSVIQRLRNDTQSHELLFERLPKDFGYTSFSSSLADNIEASKRYYDSLIDELRERIKKETKKVFFKGNNSSTLKKCSLTSTVKDWCDSLDQAVFEQLFDDGTDVFLHHLSHITNDEDMFVVRLAKIATELRIEDWDDNTFNHYIERLTEFKRCAEDFQGSTSEEDGLISSSYQLIFIDDEGEAIIRRFDKTETTKRGQLLLNSITADLESMGDAISSQEKRQILMEILKKLV